MLKQANLSFSVTAQANGNETNTIQFSTQDKKTAKLIFTIKEGKAPLNLTDIDGEITLVMQDKSRFIDKVEVTKPLDGVLEYTLTQEQIRHAGRAQGEVKLTEKDGSSVGGLRFNFTIKKALMDEDLGPVKEFYINDLEAVKQEVQDIADSINSEVQEKADTVSLVIQEKANAIEITRQDVQKKADAVKKETQTRLEEVNTKATEVTRNLEQLDEEYQNKAYTVDEKLADVQATVNDLRENGTGIDAQARQEVEQVSSQLTDIAHNPKLESGISDSDKINKSLEKGNVYIPEGIYNITSIMKLTQDGQKITGAGIGRTVLLVNGKSELKGVFDIDGKNDCYISDLTIKSVDNKKSRGVYIRGNTDNNIIERVRIEGFGWGFVLEGSEGTAPGTVKNTTLRDCDATHTTIPSGGTFGICLGNTDTTLLENCRASYNWLDGIKLRLFNKNVKVIGGSVKYNGQIVPVTGSENGNGIDLYSGAEDVTLRDLTAEYNYGAGIYAKNNYENNPTDPNFTGLLQDLQFVNCTSRFNTGDGLNINRKNSDTFADAPLISGVIITGGIYEKNGENGIYLRARDVTINNPIVKLNAKQGIELKTSIDVKINEPQCLGNGTALPGNYFGINASNVTRLKIMGGSYLGVFAPYSNGLDYGTLTKITKYGININSTCADVFIDNPAIEFTSNNAKIWVGMTSGNCIINHGVWRNSYSYGSIGSTLIFNGVKYVKATGTPNAWSASDWKAITLVQ